jgi:hypothetical protein
MVLPVYERVGEHLFTFTAGSFFQNNNSILVPLTSYVIVKCWSSGRIGVDGSKGEIEDGSGTGNESRSSSVAPRGNVKIVLESQRRVSSIYERGELCCRCDLRAYDQECPIATPILNQQMGAERKKVQE